MDFEGISGLKVNFSKSELIPLNLTDEQTRDLTDVLNCKIGKLPLKYSGLWLHTGTLPKDFWRSLIVRIEARLPK